MYERRHGTEYTPNLLDELRTHLEYENGERIIVTCTLDRRRYASERKVTDEEMKCVIIVPDTLHGEQNYTINLSP